MNTNKKLQINLISSLIIFFLVTGFVFSCKKYGIRSRGVTADAYLSAWYHDGGGILWNAMASTANQGGETIAFVANIGGQILWNTTTSAANKGGEVLWNTLATAAKSIGSKLFGGNDYEEISIKESEDYGDIETESLFSVSESDGEEEKEPVDRNLLFDALDNSDEVSESGSFIYIHTVNIYNCCEQCKNKS